MIDTVLFDLDGTLLPMDQDHFVEVYMGLLGRTMTQYGYEPQALVKAVWRGVGAMVHGGDGTNEQRFWQSMGEKAYADAPRFEKFYREEFQQAQSAVGFQPAAAPLIASLRQAGYRVALATNPIFPRIATESRLRWAGLAPEDFELVTTYESCTACKPDPAYFREVLTTLNADPARCLMVGNDATEDTAAAEAGVAVYLVTDCLICPPERSIEAIPHGDFASLRGYLNENGAFPLE